MFVLARWVVGYAGILFALVVAAYAVWCLWGWCYCDLVCLLLFAICFLGVLILIVLLLELVCMVFRCFVAALFGDFSCSVVNACLCCRLAVGVGVV